MNSFKNIFLLLLIVFIVSGCAVAIIGGVAVGTSFAIDNRSAGNYVEDQNIKTKFDYLFYQDEALSEKTHVNVASYNRQVLLTGEVQTHHQKLALDNIIKQIKNIRHHYNEVIIAPSSSYSSRSNDVYLTSKIKTAIFSHIKQLDAAQVKVVTENASVFLMGLVSREQGNQITEIVRTTHGVKRVIKLFEYTKAHSKQL